jgi:hypothetical protein
MIDEQLEHMLCTTDPDPGSRQLHGSPNVYRKLGVREHFRTDSSTVRYRLLERPSKRNPAHRHVIVTAPVASFDTSELDRTYRQRLQSSA